MAKRRLDIDQFLEFIRAVEKDEVEEDEDVIAIRERRPRYEGKIDNLSDLINIINCSITYTNINHDKLKHIKDELIELNNLIGLEGLKNSILNQLLYYLQGLHKSSDDYLHTIITGGPGVGKTTIAKILGKLFSKLGILSNQKFTIARRDTLIGGYLGQTALKTQKLLDETKGGVMFIDEVYSLGNPEGRDSYSKECIDTINLFLSEQKHNFMMIVAGYEEEVEKCFFAYNAGLKRRFMWHHKIDEYSDEHMADMFKQMILKQNWKIDENFSREMMITFFKKWRKRFVNFGGDIEKFFTLVKVNHSKRVFPLAYKEKRVITKVDLDVSISKMEEKKRDEPPPGMYI